MVPANPRANAASASSFSRCCAAEMRRSRSSCSTSRRSPRAADGGVAPWLWRPEGVPAPLCGDCGGRRAPLPAGSDAVAVAVAPPVMWKTVVVSVTVNADSFAATSAGRGGGGTSAGAAAVAKRLMTSPEEDRDKACLAGPSGGGVVGAECKGGLRGAATGVTGRRPWVAAAAAAAAGAGDGCVVGEAPAAA